MPRLALSGGAYQARSVIASAQRSLNLYPEPMPQGQGEPAQFAHYPTPGLRQLNAMPQGGIRGIMQATTGGIYVVAGNGVYSVNPTTWAGTLIGNITSLRPYPVSMADNGNTLVIVDGTAGGWTVDLPSNAFAAINDPAFYGADRVDYLDTYLLFNKPGTPQFYSSDSLATTFDSLYFANKESHSDLLVSLAVAKREIWLLGERTTEIWYDSGGQSGDFPFEEIQGTFVDHGCRAKYSVAVYDDAVYWLGYDRAGQGIVFKGAGYLVQRISTFAIETELARYSRIDDAIGFVYSLGGHAVYVLTFPTADHTWCYDVTTQQWHEWLWIDTNGAEHRHRANCCYPCNGTVVVGDWQNGNLYALDQTVFTDNGSPIKRQRSFPHTINDAKRVYYREFIADLETGNTPLAAAATTTTIVTPTWPPEIAQLFGASTSIGAAIIPDWPRGMVYVIAPLPSITAYPLHLATQTMPAASGPALNWPACATVDPTSGDLLVQYTGEGNGSPVYKLNPSTFAVVGQFGVSTAFPSYPNAVLQGQGLVCVVCNGVSFGLLKETGAYVAAFRADTMQHAGFQQAVVSGSYGANATMCAGASGGTTATAFLTWADTFYTPSIQLYVVVIASSATSYDPSTWPATNPGITAATVGTIAVAQVDPTQSYLAAHAIGYDLADGNILMLVGTGASTTTETNRFVVKVRASDAAVLWTVQVTTSVNVTLQYSRIDGSLWVFDGGTSWQINTVLGTATTQPFHGTSNSIPGTPLVDSETALAVYYGGFTQEPNSPVPADSGTASGSGWYVMGGATTTSVVVTHAQLEDDRIWLDWSDDRGHSYGNPVSQNIGKRGAYLTSLQWQRLAYARDRVFRLTWSSPLATALQGAWVEILGAGST